MNTKTRFLTLMAMFAAISVLLVYFIRIPMFLPFLEYDPADIPIFIMAFAFGPAAGLILTTVVALIQGLTVSASSGIIGIVMHIFATGSFVLIAGNIYKHNRTLKGAIIALLCGILVMMATMVLWNLLITPLYLGVSTQQVLGLLLPAIVPFNLIKAGINSALTFVLYKAVEKLIKKIADSRTKQAI